MTVLITGTGKSGTTFLLNLLSNLGFDTKFSPDPPYETGWGQWNIRGEHARKENQPRIIKSPSLCSDLLNRIKKWDWDVEHVYVMFREYDQVASNKYHFRHKLKPHPGMPSEEEYKIEYVRDAAINIGLLMSQLVTAELPYTFILFPRAAVDPEYLYSKCKLLQEVSYETFLEGFNKVSDIGMVHWGLEDK